MATPLEELLVADLSSGIPGGYCTKLLVDGGAGVVKLEDAAGDPLRSWSATGRGPEGEDGALFGYLAAGKGSVLADPGSRDGVERALEVISDSDAIVWSSGSALAGHPRFCPAALHDQFPAATVVALSPFGLAGPWAGRAATEFTLQGWAGAIGWRSLEIEGSAAASRYARLHCRAA